MRDPWADRQVLLAIGVTLILVIGLVLSTVSRPDQQGPGMLWKDTP